MLLMATEIKRLYISVSRTVVLLRNVWIENLFCSDRDNMYNGRVFGETQSSVRAHIDNGVITGSIVLPDETYHIEVSVNLMSISFNF